MKKQWKVLFLLIISCGLLFACSQNEKWEGSKTDKENVVEKEKTPEEEQKEDQTDEQEAVQEDEMDDQLAEVLKQATAKNKAFKSYSIESTTDTVEEFNGEKNHLLATELIDIISDTLQVEITIEQVTESDKENAVVEPWVYEELLFNSYQVEEYKVEIAIDKSSYYLTTITTNKLIFYDMEFKDEKNKMTHTNEIVSTYKNYDKVKEIAVPNDVLENAREINN